MLKKVFILTQFGSPHSWTNQFIDHVQHLQKYGWYWKIMTPNNLASRGNVEICPMTTDQFNDLVEKKLGVRPQMFMTPKGVPSVHVTDFYVASGVIFEDYLKDADFWGITNIDVVYGRLDHFVPDSVLEDCDVWTDDINIINGVFCLFRNNPEVNDIFKGIANWEQKLGQPPCEACMGTGKSHFLFGTDEYDMTNMMNRLSNEGQVRYKGPAYYPIHSYDRLEQHYPDPKLEMQADGSLWERFNDVSPPPGYVHFPKGYIAKEIGYFHFIRTKKWPNIGTYDISKQ